MSGIITKDASVSIGEGLPNDTRPKAIQAAASKGRGGNRGGQQQVGNRGRGQGSTTRGGFAHRAAPGPPPDEDVTYDSMQEEDEDGTYDVVPSPAFAARGGRGGLGSVIGRGGGGGGGGGRGRGGSIPGPPRGPMPAHQPTFKASRGGSRASRGNRGRPPQVKPLNKF